MEKENQQQKFAFQIANTNANMHEMTNDESLKNILLTSMRRIQESSSSSSLKSVSEENFTTSASSSSKTFATMASATMSGGETTGGNEMLTDGDKKTSSMMMMELGACPIGKTMIAHQQQQQKQQSSIASSSSSSIASLATETMRKTKTLSFLHNEDLFTAGATVISGGNSSSNSLHNDDKLVPTASHLFRSISFQEQRRQYQKSSLQRAESGRESAGDAVRKMAILSPKHSLLELNERIKQQQMRMQQQMYYGSSEFSL